MYWPEKSKVSFGLCVLATLGTRYPVGARLRGMLNGYMRGTYSQK